MTRYSPGLDVGLRNTIFGHASMLSPIMERGVGWSIVMDQKVERSGMSYPGAFGIRMDNCIQPVNGMMLFMDIIRTVVNLGDMVSVAQTSLDLGASNVLCNASVVDR